MPTGPKSSDNSSQRKPEAAGARGAGAGRPVPKKITTPHAREGADDAPIAAKFPRYRLAKTAELLQYKNNPRTHSDAQIAKIVRSIEQFGFTNPILTDGDAGVIAGHGRLLAAMKLGLETVPTIELKHLTAAQRKAYVIADNRLAEEAGWDLDLLRLELGDLRDMGFDLDLTGFDPMEVDKLFGPEGGNTDPDEVPEAPTVPTTRTGDVWLLGRHRLVCGDCTDAAVVEAVMDGRLADLCFTSPPYAEQREYKGGVLPWDDLMEGAFGVLPAKDNAQIVVNLGLVHRDGEWMPYWETWIAWMREQGWRRFGWYVWDQGPGLPGDWNGRLAPSHEFVFHFNRVAERARKTKAKLAASVQYNDHGNGMRKRDGTMSGVASPEKSLQTHKVPDSVIRIMRHKARGPEVAHPAVFPVDLVTEMLTAFSDAGNIVFEPFCGSGTQLISAQQNGRVCHAIEIAPVYVDVAVLRWQNFTGEAATLAADGRTFAAIAAERGAG